MRYIDADALKDRLQAISYDDWNQGVSTTWANAYAEFADMVEDMPTIEPERKGKWIITHDGGLNTAVCSECKYMIGHIVGCEYFRYCPKCGARLEVENE